MNVGSLLEIVRTELDDAVEPFLWKTPELVEHCDDAQNEACRRGRLIVDSSTEKTCQIALEAGTAVYALDARIIRVNRAKVAGESLPMKFCMSRDLDARYAGWEDDTAPTPTVIVPDWETGLIRVVPAPTVDGTLAMTVVRLPLTPLTGVDQALEIRAHYQRNLRHWIAHRAYLKRDSETYDPKKAAEALAYFEREFGPPRPAYDEEWMLQYYMSDTHNGRY